MLSLFRKVGTQGPALGFYALTSLLAVGEAGAVDTYFIPQVEAVAETHDNLNLRPRVSEDGSQTGYSGSLGGIAGFRAPTGQTEIRPRFLFQKFSDRDELSELNGYLDVSSAYRTLRSRFFFLGRYSQENQYNAEISQAQFDDLDPEVINPDGTPEDSTGRLFFSNTKTKRLQLAPDYSFQLNQRMGVGVRALYQTAEFSGQTNTSRDYDFSQLTGYLSWILSQRAQLQTGLYTTRYETDDGENETTSNGLSANLQYVWDPTFTGTAGVKVEETKIDQVAREESSTSWGFQVGVRRRAEISRIEATAGRMFSPSSGGVRVVRDEVRAQYTRSLSALWNATGAVRAYRNKSQGDAPDDNDRKFARADLSLNRQLTRTWYVGAQYSYLWQEYYVDAESGKDNVFMLRIGYEGLAPPKR